MKFPANSQTFGRWAPAHLRHCLTAEHAHRLCPLRKCRRDRRCSGPLVASDESRNLSPHLGEPPAADPEVTLMPFCFLHLPLDWQHRAACAFAAGVETLLARPGATVVEATRTIGARRWRRLRLDDFQPGGPRAS